MPRPKLTIEAPADPGASSESPDQPLLRHSSCRPELAGLAEEASPWLQRAAIEVTAEATPRAGSDDRALLRGWWLAQALALAASVVPLGSHWLWSVAFPIPLVLATCVVVLLLGLGRAQVESDIENPFKEASLPTLLSRRSTPLVVVQPESSFRQRRQSDDAAPRQSRWSSDHESRCSSDTDSWQGRRSGTDSRQCRPSDFSNEGQGSFMKAHNADACLAQARLTLVPLDGLLLALQNEPADAVLASLHGGEALKTFTPAAEANFALVSYRQERHEDGTTIDGAALRSVAETARLAGVDSLWLDAWCYTVVGRYDHDDFVQMLAAVAKHAASI